MTSPTPDTRVENLRDGVRAVLLTDWDPHNASRDESAHGTYDQYLDPLISLIESGATEDDVVAFLEEREAETMCFPSLGVERLRRPARKLLRLRAV